MVHFDFVVVSQDSADALLLLFPTKLVKQIQVISCNVGSELYILKLTTNLMHVSNWNLCARVK